MKKPELLAPAGNWEMLISAVDNGADAIYFGIDKLNMRAKAKNFKLDEIDKISSYCRNNGVDTHLTVNSIVFNHEIGDLELTLRTAKSAGIDLIICWDFAVIQMCRTMDLKFCISTQASVSNSSSATFYRGLGASRIVLARECTLEQIREIKENSGIEIEVFAHGAMCVALSGRCFMSHHIFGKSANRGECIQPCRREFEIYDRESDTSMLLGEDYVLSPKDLCTVEFIDKLIDTGVDSLKIEGRKRSPEYVAKAVKIYREAIDLYADGNLTVDKKKMYLMELEKVYNRGFSSGFYFGEPSGSDYADIYGSKATTKKEYIGKVINYYKKSNIAHVKIESGEVAGEDEIYIIGSSTGVVELNLNSIMCDGEYIDKAPRGMEITFKCDSILRPNDKVYKIIHIDRDT